MTLTDIHLARKRAAIHEEALRLGDIYFFRYGGVPSRISEIARATVPETSPHKFDPYHDPANGQFTFGPGGEADSQLDDNSDNQGQGTVSDELNNLLLSLLGIGTAHAEDNSNGDNILNQPPAGKDPGSVDVARNDGSVVLNPYNNNKPLIQPDGVSLSNNIEIGEGLRNLPSVFVNGTNSDSFQPVKEATMISLFNTWRPMDYQRVYADNGTFNSQYTDFGNYNYGIVAAAAGYTLNEALLAAGLKNLIGTGDKSGDMYNNPRNEYFIRSGYDDYQKGSFDQ